MRYNTGVCARAQAPMRGTDGHAIRRYKEADHQYGMHGPVCSHHLSGGVAHLS